LQRGPIVYCRERQDQLQVVDLRSPIEVSTQPEGTVTLQGRGTSGAERDWQNQLYRPASGAKPNRTPVRWVATPYCQWANRGVSPMRVWLPAAESPEAGGPRRAEP
jgi:uncharacterized protein